MKRISPDELPYAVESVDIVAELPDLRVSVLAFARGQEVPWHYHTEVTDTFYCLAGPILIEHGLRGSTELSVGESYAVPPGTPHRVSGAGGGPGRFLIVQGVGSYDFIPTRNPSGRSST